jgi:hypothetical protein
VKGKKCNIEVKSTQNKIVLNFRDYFSIFEYFRTCFLGASLLPIVFILIAFIYSHYIFHKILNRVAELNDDLFQMQKKSIRFFPLMIKFILQDYQKQKGKTLWEKMTMKGKNLRMIN